MIVEELLGTLRDAIKKTSSNIVGKPLEVEERTFIPIITVSNLFNDLEVHRGGENPQVGGFLITPIAIVVIDSQGEQALSLQDKEISLSYLTENVHGLVEKIKEVHSKRTEV